jgi:hypothetical protein
MRLDFSLTLPEELYAQLAGEALESVLASRRLPKITPAALGAQMRGVRRAAVEHEDETPADAGLV